MSKVQCVGLDVHAETITVAVAELDGEVRSMGTIPNRLESIRKLIHKLGPVEHLPVSHLKTSAGTSHTGTALLFLGGFLQLRPILPDHHGVDRKVLGLAVDRQFEALGQQRPQHRLNVVRAGVCAFGFGDDGVLIHVEPSRSALHSHALNFVSESNDLQQLAIVDVQRAVVNSQADRVVRDHSDHGFARPAAKRASAMRRSMGDLLCVSLYLRASDEAIGLLFKDGLPAPSSVIKHSCYQVQS